MLHAQPRTHVLDDIFLRQRYPPSDLYDNGMDALIRMIKSERITKEMIESSAVDLYQNRLHLLPATSIRNHAMFESTVLPALIYCINAIQAYYDYTFVDLGDITVEQGDRWIQQADIIVWNLSQNRTVLEELKVPKESDRTKMFYVIGNYDPCSQYNVNYIRKKLNVSWKQIGVIPYNVMFKDAISDGSLIKYISQIVNSSKDEINHYFYCELEKTTTKLLQCMNAFKQVRARQ